MAVVFRSSRRSGRGLHDGEDAPAHVDDDHRRTPIGFASAPTKRPGRELHIPPRCGVLRGHRPAVHAAAAVPLMVRGSAGGVVVCDHAAIAVVVEPGCSGRSAFLITTPGPMRCWCGRTDTSAVAPCPPTAGLAALDAFLDSSLVPAPVSLIDDLFRCIAITGSPDRTVLPWGVGERHRAIRGPCKIGLAVIKRRGPAQPARARRRPPVVGPRRPAPRRQLPARPAGRRVVGSPRPARSGHPLQVRGCGSWR